MTCFWVFGLNKTTSMPAHVCYKSNKGAHLFQYQIKLIRVPNQSKLTVLESDTLFLITQKQTRKEVNLLWRNNSIWSTCNLWSLAWQSYTYSEESRVQRWFVLDRQYKILSVTNQYTKLVNQAIIFLLINIFRTLFLSNLIHYHFNIYPKSATYFVMFCCHSSQTATDSLSIWKTSISTLIFRRKRPHELHAYDRNILKVNLCAWNYVHNAQWESGMGISVPNNKEGKLRILR